MKVQKRTNKDGTTAWTTVVALPNDPVTGARRQKRVTASTRRAVEQEVARIRHELGQGTYLEPTTLTLGEYLERWLTVIHPKVRPQSADMYRRICRARIGPVLGRIPLAALSPIHIQDFYSGRMTAGLSTTTVRSYHAVLYSALQHAVRLRLLVSNPADAVERPRPAHVEMRTWDRAQVRTFLEVTATDPLGPFWCLAVVTGLPQGELLGLRWQDVDFERGTISVQRGVIRGETGGREFGPPKSKSGQRQVALPAPGVAALRAHRTCQLELRLAAGPAWREQGLIFPRDDGDIYPPATLRKRLDEATRRAGLPRIRFHDLRHTSATLSLALGEHPKVVSERLGHASIQMTLDRYSHVSASMQREAADRLGEALFMPEPTGAEEGGEAAEGAPESASDHEVTTG